MGTPSVVTVALTPYDAAKLIGSSRIGQLQLMLRPADGSTDDKSIGYYVIPLPGNTASSSTPAPAVQRDYTPRPAPQAPAAPSGDGGGDAGGLSGIEVIRGTSATRGK